MKSLDDTIAAIASAPGGAPRGIVRISGPETLQVLQRCFPNDPGVFAEQRRAVCLPGKLRLDELSRVLDVDVLWWPTRQSYTGQPAAEIHLVGSPPLVQATLAAVCRAGCRVAQPGEFTLRAVLAGRLDFTQAEAVLGVIDARGDVELRVAIDQLAGGIGAPLRQLRSDLLDTLAHLEAGLDFVEEDISFVTHEVLTKQIAAGLHILDDLARRLATRHSTLDLPRVALVGLPNAGKSSLFNALASSGQAIVSPQAGTTRDYLSTQIEIDGLACELIDTAGAEETPGPSIARAAQLAREEQTTRADVTVLCIDPGMTLTLPDSQSLTELAGQATLYVWTKCDDGGIPLGMAEQLKQNVPFLATSSLTGGGLDTLRRAIRARLVTLRGSDLPLVATTAERCRQSLHDATDSLLRAQQVLSAGEGEELLAAELRLALDAIGEMVGAVWTDDILDRIFSRFCIGK